MSVDGRTLAAVIGGGVALAAGAAFAGYQVAQWQHRKAHALDVVEELLGSPPSSGHAKFVDDHGTAAPHSHSHHHGGSLLAHIDSDAPSSPTVVAVGGAGAAGGAGMSTPSRRTKSHEDVRPDSVFPTGGALVAGAAADPSGLRRKMSLERRRGAPVIIGVAGASGSGKTSIAELIAERLSDQVVLSISSDNYYKTLGPDVNPGEGGGGGEGGGVMRAGWVRSAIRSAGGELHVVDAPAAGCVSFMRRQRGACRGDADSGLGVAVSGSRVIHAPTAGCVS
jgi:hypothetical protein